MQKAIANHDADLADAEYFGEQRGMEKVAKNMLAKKVPLDFIQSVTELDLETIKKLQEQQD
jgi:hypothetical protein